MIRQKKYLISLLGLFLLLSIHVPLHSAFKPATANAIQDEKDALKLTWKMLEDIKYEERWNEEIESYFFYPIFNKRLLALQAKQVYITGYMIPIDVEANFYVLSAFPFANCFFCGAAGPESVITIKFKGNTGKYHTDDRVTISGKLRLNEDDINELNYILDDAEEYKFAID